MKEQKTVKTKNDKKVEFRLPSETYNKLVAKSEEEKKKNVSTLMREIVDIYTSI